jgi:hypothetical protein
MDASKANDAKDLQPVGSAVQPAAGRREQGAALGAPAQAWPDFASAMRRVEAEVYDVA